MFGKLLTKLDNRIVNKVALGSKVHLQRAEKIYSVWSRVALCEVGIRGRGLPVQISYEICAGYRNSEQFHKN